MKNSLFDLNKVRARRIAHLSRGDSEVKNSGDNPNSDFDDLLPSGLSDFNTGIAPGNQEDAHLNI